MAALNKEYATYAHKKFFAKNQWAMCKVSVVYKLSSAMTARDVEKKKVGGGDFETKTVKNVATSGAFALLNGLTEEDLQKTTDAVVEVFLKRMKEEAGVDVITWSKFKDNKETADLKKSAEETELYNSQGLAYAKTYDETPHYNRLIVLVPGGKKLAKSISSNVMELTIIVDFAEVMATAEAKIVHQYGSGTYSLPDVVDQTVVPGVRIVPNNKTQATMEAATNLTNTQLKGHDEYGYMFSTTLTKDIVSDKIYANSIEESKELPELFQGRKNNKIENVLTLNINTTQPQYESAVVDAFNKYLDDIIKIYNYSKGGGK